MKLLNRTENFVAGLRNLKQLQAEAGQLKRYATRHDQLHQTSVLLAGLSEIVEELRGKGVPPVINTTQALDLKRRANTLAAAFKADRKNCLNENQESTYTFWNPLRQYPGSIMEAVHEAWTGYVRSRTPAIDDQILSILDLVPGFRPHVEKVRGPLKRLQALATEPLRDMPDFASVDGLAQMIRQAWASLEGGGIPPQVLDFLKAAHLPGGATLDSLSSEVVQWLCDKNLLVRYRIVVRR